MGSRADSRSEEKYDGRTNKVAVASDLVFSWDADLLLICGAIATVGGTARRAQERLNEATEIADQLAEMRRMTFAGIGDAVITTDSRGKVTYLNVLSERFTGYTTQEAIGLPLGKVFRLIDETTRQPLANPGMEALEKRRIVGLGDHTILIARDNTERLIDDSAAHSSEG